MTVHLLERCQQELVEFRVAHVVVHDLAGRFFHVYIVRGIGKHKISLHAIHQGIVALSFRGVTAQNTVPAQHPKVTCLREGRLLQLRFHIEVIFLDVLVVDLVEQRLDLRRLKARLAQVEVGVFDILQQVSQQGIIPRTGDFVECDVQGFLSGLVDVHHRTRHFGIAQCHRNGQALMTADDRHIGIDHQRISKTELLNGVLDLLVLLVPRLQLLPGIVCGWLEYGHRQHFQFSSCFHVAPPSSNSHTHDLRKRYKKGAELKARLQFVAVPAHLRLRFFRNRIPFRVFPVHGSKNSVLCMVNLMYTDACGVADCKYANHFIFQCCSLPSPCLYWHRLDCNTFSEVRTGGGRKTLCRTSGRPLTARSSSSAVLGGCCSTWIGIQGNRISSVVPDGSERWQHHTADRMKTPYP